MLFSKQDISVNYSMDISGFSEVMLGRRCIAQIYASYMTSFLYTDRIDMNKTYRSSWYSPVRQFRSRT